MGQKYPQSLLMFNSILYDYSIVYITAQVLVEQVLSAGNFELFKLMMVKTKLTLQQQAASMNQSPASEVAPVASDSEVSG